MTAVSGSAGDFPSLRSPLATRPACRNPRPRTARRTQGRGHRRRRHRHRLLDGAAHPARRRRRADQRLARTPARRARDKLAEEFPDRTVAQLTCNVQDTAEVDDLIAGATTELGRIDVLVNNAGLGGETPSHR